MFERYRYIPTVESQSIRGKLRVACQDPLNASMEFCKNVDTMIRNGDESYERARSWSGGKLAMTFKYYCGMIDGPENTIFTEPQSFEYCEQYYSLHTRVNVQHPDARYDVKKILKMRVNAETNVCGNWLSSQPVQFKPAAQALEDRLHSLRFYWQAQNATHPIFNVYKVITEIVQEQKLRNVSYSTNQVYSFFAAGEEIINVMVKQKMQPDYINFNISSALALTPKHYIQLATEPVRLIQAQALHEINNTAITPLMALVMTSRTDARYGANLYKMLTRDLDMELDRGFYLTFDQMPEEQLTVFNLLIYKHNFNITHAINFLDYAVDFNYKKGLKMISPDNIIEAANQRIAFMNNIDLLTYCSPYNATSIVGVILSGMFREQLEIAMQPCANMARRLEHGGFHIHNMLSRDYHARIHELEDRYRVEDDSQLLMITAFLSFIMALALLTGIYRVTRPLVKKCFSKSSDRIPRSKNTSFVNYNDDAPIAVFEAMEITSSTRSFFYSQGKKNSISTYKETTYTSVSKVFSARN